MATNEELKDQLDLIENKIDSNDGYIKEVFNKNIELVSPIAQDVDLGNGVVLPNLKKANGRNRRYCYAKNARNWCANTNKTRT